MTAHTLMFAPELVETAPADSAPFKPMDEGRFESFYRSTSAGIRAYLHRLTGDPAAADDLLQKTYIRFLHADPMVQSEEHTRRYLYKTATSVALDYFRETRRRGEREPMMEPPSHHDTSDLRHDMLRAFAELKPQERALLWLAHVEESGHDEIGVALGVKPKSVKVLLFRARKKLAELLTRRGIGPEALP